MSARRAASSMRAEVDTLTRAGGAVQLLLRSEKERAEDDARVLREAAGPYYYALKRRRHGQLGAPPKPAEPLPIAHSPYPRCEPLATARRPLYIYARGSSVLRPPLLHAQHIGESLRVAGRHGRPSEVFRWLGSS